MSEMTPPIPLQLLLGPTGHGVTAYGADIAARVLAGEPEARIVHAAGVREAESAAAEAPRAHLHVTARLLGASPEEAAEGLERLASATRLSITLHDLPQPSDGRMMARRVDAYRRMVEAADGPESGAFLAADRAFHAEVLALSGNAMLGRLRAVIEEGLRHRATVERGEQAPDRHDLGLHQEVAAAIGAGDEPGAAARMREIIERATRAR